MGGPVLQAELENARNDLVEESRRFVNAKILLEQREAQLNQYENTIEKLNQLNSDMRNRLLEYEFHDAELSHQTRIQDEKISDLNDQINNWRRTCEHIKNDYNTVAGDLEDWKSSYRVAMRENDAQKTEMDRMRNEISKRYFVIYDLKNDLEQKEDQIK